MVGWIERRLPLSRGGTDYDSETRQVLVRILAREHNHSLNTLTEAGNLGPDNGQYVYFKVVIGRKYMFPWEYLGATHNKVGAELTSLQTSSIQL